MKYSLKKLQNDSIIANSGSKSSKVAFFIDNANLPVIDYSAIARCNPGIGGTEYEFMLVSYLLDIRNNDCEIIVLTNHIGDLPHSNVVRCNNLIESCSYCVKNGVDTIIVRNIANDFDFSPFKGKLNFILWVHNNLSYKELNKHYKNPCIERIVNCGREQLELYRDNLATLKSTYIYNIFPFREIDYYRELIDTNDNHNVVYMGSLVWSKGFHVLAKCWKEVVKKVPDAQLFVIGSGKLYNKDLKLGKYSLAEREYEDLFMPYITDRNGKILDSVHFMGLLGDEKYEILGKCKVAVPNPTGMTECLPITAIEMQLLGCGITTIYHPAYLDTVYNKDFLFKNEEEIADSIVHRLLAPKDIYEDVYDFLSNNFGQSYNIERWENCLKNLDIQFIEPISKYNYQNKKIKNIMLTIKQIVPILSAIPEIERIYNKLGLK